MPALTLRSVKQIRPGLKRRELPDKHCPGLFLLIQPSGARSWAVRYRAAGRPRKHTLGRYPAIGLVRARELARDALQAVAKGGDPQADKNEARRLEVSGLADATLVGSV